MKSVIAAVGCAIVAFLGLYLYLAAQRHKPDDVPTVATLPAEAEPQADEESPPQSKPSPPTANSSKPPTAKAPERKPAQAKAPNTKPVQTSKEMYYTAVPDNRGGPVPSRITIHNTDVGDFTILLIGAGTSDGRLFTSKGTTSGPKKHQWEVEVSEGYLTVLWDGQTVRPGENRKVAHAP